MTSAQHVENPTDSDYAASASEALGKKEYRQALQQVSAALCLNPLSEEHRRLLETILDRAKSPLQLLPEAEPFYGLQVARARALVRTKRLNDAVSLLFVVVAFRPHLPFLAWTNDWCKSASDFRALDPEDVAAGCLKLTQALAHSAQVPIDANLRMDPAEGRTLNFTVASSLAERVARRHPENPRLWVARSRLLRAAGFLDDALEFHEACEAALNETWDVAVERAALLRELGRRKDGIKWLEKAGQLRPSEPSTFLDLGDDSLLIGDLEGAIASYARAEGSSWATLALSYGRGLSAIIGGKPPASAPSDLDAGEEAAAFAARIDEDLMAYRAHVPAPSDDLVEVMHDYCDRLRHAPGAGKAAKVRAHTPLCPSAKVALAALLDRTDKQGDLLVEAVHEGKFGPLGSADGETPPDARSSLLSEAAAQLVDTTFDSAEWDRKAKGLADSLKSVAPTDIQHALLAATIPAEDDVDPVLVLAHHQLAVMLLVLHASDSTAVETLTPYLEAVDEWSGAAAWGAVAIAAPGLNPASREQLSALANQQVEQIGDSAHAATRALACAGLCLPGSPGPFVAIRAAFVLGA